MSRFFRNAGDSDSSSESSISSSENDEGPLPQRSRFAQSDSEEDDVKRVIRSAASRRFRMLVDISNNVKNHMKVGDWGKLQEDFDDLNAALQKVMKTDMVSGRTPPVPEVYVRAIITISDFLKKTLTEKPKLSKTNQTSLNKMKLRIPKNDKLYSKEIELLRVSGKPSLLDVDYDMDDSFDGEKKNERVKDKINSESSSDTESVDSSSSENESGAGGSRWLIKESDTNTSMRKKDRKERKKLIKAGDGADESNLLSSNEDGGFTQVRRKNDPPVFVPEEMTEASVDEKIVEVLQSRGRKGTNRQEQISVIQSLAACAKSPKQLINIMMHLISAQFDCIPPAKLFMPASLWGNARDNALKVVELSKAHYPAIRFSDETDEAGREPSVLLKGGIRTREILDPMGNPLAGTTLPNLGDAEPQNKIEIGADGEFVVRGDLATTVERLDDQLFKAWQNIDAYSPQYVERLRDDAKFLELAAAAQDYFETTADAEESKIGGNELNIERITALRSRAARIASRRIMHMYFMSDDLSEKVQQLTGRKISSKSLTALSVLVYRYGDERSKSQTMLAAIYKHALENRFFAARDMLLMSHLQESIAEADIPLQVMFNRAMTQLGLCAFRLGMTREAHACLQELCSPGFGGAGGGPARMREMLAQGISQQRGYDKTVEQEKAELRRQIPYHLHINLDFIETAHLTSAMLLEVPAMALSKARGDVRRWPISKSFQYFLRNSMKQAFPGPPENTRDFVMAATRCLMKGDWRQAYAYIAGIRSWKSLTVSVRAATLGRLKELLKVDALRTFSLSYSSFFESMSTPVLAAKFNLSEAKVHSTLSKMIINCEMRASWDQPTASIVMRRTEPTRLQNLALQLSAKTTNMSDNNEKLLDTKAGSGDRDRGDRKDDRDRQARGDWKHGGRGGRVGRGREKDRGHGGSVLLAF